MVKVVSVHAREACNWGRCIVFVIRYFHITLDGGLEANFTPRALNLGKNSPGSRSTGDWVSPRVGVEYRKISGPYRESNHLTFPQYPQCYPSSKCAQSMRQNVLFVNVNRASRWETWRWEGSTATYFGYETMYDYVDSPTTAVTQHHVLDGCYETAVFGLISLETSGVFHSARSQD